MEKENDRRWLQVQAAAAGALFFVVGAGVVAGCDYEMTLSSRAPSGYEGGHSTSEMAFSKVLSTTLEPILYDRLYHRGHSFVEEKHDGWSLKISYFQCQGILATFWFV